METPRAPGDRLGDYVLGERLGDGGMGEVWAARGGAGAPVAIKLLHVGHEGDKERARLRREAELAAAVAHPHVVRVIEVLALPDGAPAIVMERLDGETLAARLERDGPLPLGAAAALFVPVVSAVGAAHAQGIVHRDLKPENVFLARGEGDAVVVKVLDFGVAKLTSGDPALRAGILTTTGALVGTPCYMAPEQIGGEVDLDHRADVWALGVMLYQCLSGVLPTAGDNLGQVFKAIHARALWPLAEVAPEVSPDVAALVDRMLSRRRRDRPALREVEETLQRHTAVRAPAFGPSTVRLAARPPEERAPPGVPGSPRDEAAPAARESEPAGAPSSRRAGLVGDRALVAVGAAVLGAFLLVALGTTGVLTYSALAARQAAAGAAASSSASSVASAASAAAPSSLGAVQCGPATVEGRADIPALARAVGLGACARAATELGVPWGAEGTPLGVDAHLRRDGATVTLTLAGARASAEGRSVKQAMTAASLALAAAAGRPVPPEEVRAWGARDAESARRIRSLWRRASLRLIEIDDVMTEARALAIADPGSPFPHALLVRHWLDGVEGVPGEAELALAHLDALPPARASGLRGAMLLATTGSLDLLGSRNGSAEIGGLLRQAWVDGAADPDVPTFFVYPNCYEGPEVPALLEQIHDRSLPAATPMLLCQISGLGPDEARWERNVERLRAASPEMLSTLVFPLLAKGKDALAREMTALYVALTDPDPGAPLPFEFALALLEPEMARRAAEARLANPSWERLLDASTEIIFADLMRGHVADAEAELNEEIERQRVAGHAEQALDLALREATLRRRLGRPPPARPHLDILEAAARRPETPLDLRVSARVELALLGGPRPPSPAVARRVMAEIDEDLERGARGDPRLQKTFAPRLFPLLRVARGDAALGQLFHELSASSWRRLGAFDVGLALERAGDREGAAAAYAAVLEVYGLRRTIRPFEVIAARVRLADLRRATGRAEEAAALDAVVDRVWATADPGLREAVRRLR
jgi:hypothetical protein